MIVRVHLTLIAVALALTGCAALEQYHFPQTQDNVPVDTVLAFSDKYPNLLIKSIEEQKLFNGTTQYAITTSDKNNAEKIVTFTSKGQEVAPF